jgi:hypothetical protein
MNINAQELHNMFTLIIDSGTNPAAEDRIVSWRMDTSYLMVLCDYLANLANTPNLDKAMKKYALFGCIELKNSVQSVWAEHTRMGIEQLQIQLRPKIFQLMFVFDEQCSQFVCDAVNIIAKLDFPERWDTLMTDTVNMMRDDNHRYNYLCWSLIEANTKKYVWLERSDELFSEIIKVINE